MWDKTYKRHFHIFHGYIYFHGRSRSRVVKIVLLLLCNTGAFTAESFAHAAVSDSLALKILIYCTTPDDIPVEDNAALTRSLGQKQTDSLQQVSVSNKRGHTLQYKFPPHPCFQPYTLYPAYVFYSSLVLSRRALVNQQRDTDPWAQHLLTSQPPIQARLEAEATEKPDPAWQGPNNRFLPHPGPHG